MAIPRVDDVRYKVDRHPPRLTVWLFNDDSFYADTAADRVARYDFDRRLNPDGTSPDRKEKLDVGIYRTPFRDGWRYTISSDVHEPLCALIIRYATHGWKTDENGERVPATYLRHNRKALGIFDLIKRYLLVRDECLLVNDGLPEKIVDYHVASSDFGRMPCFQASHKRLREFEGNLEDRREEYRENRRREQERNGGKKPGESRTIRRILGEPGAAPKDESGGENSRER